MYLSEIDETAGLESAVRNIIGEECQIVLKFSKTGRGLVLRNINDLYSLVRALRQDFVIQAHHRRRTVMISGGVVSSGAHGDERRVII